MSFVSGGHPLPSLERKSYRGARIAFTLVELLVVIGIIGLLAAVSLPAMMGLAKSSRGGSGINLIISALDQARTLAIAQATPAYLVLANGDPGWPAEYRGRSFAIFSETYSPSTETYQQFQVTNWTTLPEGLSFRPYADTVFNPEAKRFYFPLARKELPAASIKFTTIGAIEEPAETRWAHVRLAEARFDSALSSAPNHPTEYGVRLVLPTGRAVREEVLPGE